MPYRGRRLDSFLRTGLMVVRRQKTFGGVETRDILQSRFDRQQRGADWTREQNGSRDGTLRFERERKTVRGLSRIQTGRDGDGGELHHRLAPAAGHETGESVIGAKGRAIRQRPETFPLAASCISEASHVAVSVHCEAGSHVTGPGPTVSAAGPKQTSANAWRHG